MEVVVHKPLGVLLGSSKVDEVQGVGLHFACGTFDQRRLSYTGLTAINQKEPSSLLLNQVPPYVMVVVMAQAKGVLKTRQ